MTYRQRSIRHLGLCCAAALLAMTFLAAPASAQPNDNCAMATAIAGLPFNDAPATGAATIGVGDPVPSCGTLDNNVWYSFAAGSATSLELLTAGSGYDTNVAVYTGACGALTEIACNDDTPSGTDSQIIVPLAPGDVVLISVASSTPGGGALNFDAIPSPSKIFKPRTLHQIFTSADPTPLGASYGAFDVTATHSKRDIGFSARTHGIFVRAPGGALNTIAVSGSASPVGGTFATFGEPSINSLGEIAFYAQLDGGPVDHGIFRQTLGVLGPAFLVGDISPDGGVYERFGKNVDLAESGNIAFIARSDISPGDMLLVDDGIATTIAATDGDVTPCGGTFSTLGAGSEPPGFDLDNVGTSVAFYARVSGGGDDGVFVSTAGAITLSACESDATPLGGTIQRIGQQPAIGGGMVYFAADLSGAPANEAIFTIDGAGTVASALAEGDILATGETVDDIDRNITLSTNLTADLAAVVRLAGLGDAIVHGPLAGAASAVLVEGMACPGFGTVEQLDHEYEINDAADIAFEGSCTAGRGAYVMPFGAPPTAAGLVTDATAAGTGFKAHDPRINTTGEVAFRGWRSASYVASCNSSGVCLPPVTTANLSMGIAGLAGQHLDTMYTETLNGDSRQLAFAGLVAGVSRNPAIIRVRNLNPAFATAVAVTGQALPGGVGTFSDFPLSGSITGAIAVPSANKKAVAFLASMSGHPAGASDGLYVFTSSGVHEVVVDGMVGPTGGTFVDFDVPVVRNKTLVFRAATGIDDCLYHLRSVTGSPVLTILACDGDPGPPGVGGTLSFLDVPPAGGKKEIVFAAEITGGTASQCLISARVGVGLTAVACTDNPYIHGEYMDSFDQWSPYGAASAEAKGKGFTYWVEGSETNSLHLVAWRKNRQFALFSDSITTTPGGAPLFIDLFPTASMNKKTVSFPAALSGGPVQDSVVMATIK